jgi:hypothetical protein
MAQLAKMFVFSLVVLQDFVRKTRNRTADFNRCQFVINTQICFSVLVKDTISENAFTCPLQSLVHITFIETVVDVLL